MAREQEQIVHETGNPEADNVDIVIAANLFHYGTEKGRYAKYSNVTVPAIEKCIQGREEEKVHQNTEECMALTLIDA